MKKLFIFTIIAMQTACAQMALQAFEKHPSSDDIGQMSVGTTKLNDVKAKYSGYKVSMVQDKTCLMWYKVGLGSAVGSSAGSSVTGLCFKDGLLSDKNYQAD